MRFAILKNFITTDLGKFDRGQSAEFRFKFKQKGSQKGRGQRVVQGYRIKIKY